MMGLKRKVSCGLFFLLYVSTVFNAFGQATFKYESTINKVDSSGFYKIGLLPAFVAKSNIDLSDIRVIDNNGHFVPYISFGNLPLRSQAQFTVFPTVAIKSKADTGTTFVVENNQTQPVNRLWVKLRNTAVQRTINLYGSDDLKRWFAIEEDIPLQQAIADSDGIYLQALAFPPSNYRYLKLLVNDKNKAPLKFLEAGRYTESASESLYFPISGASFLKKDSDRTTYIRFQLNDNYLVNKISLNITAPKYYKRDVSVYEITRHGLQLVSSAELNSSRNGPLLIAAKTNQLELQIANGDNVPLEIKTIQLAQDEQYIVAYLEVGKTYKLLTGDLKATAPEYDLKFFADSIGRKIPEMGEGLLTKNRLYNERRVQAQKEYPALIWAAIVIALLLLLALTWKMVGEVNRKG
jgi:hypothetical protein